MVLVPDFLLNIARKRPEGVQLVTENGQFAREVAETVRNIPWDGDLRDLAASCLSVNSKLRPRITDVLDKLMKPGVES